MTVIDQNEAVDLPLDRNDPALAPIKGIPVVDVDTHLTEPGDLWTSRAPAAYRDKMPRVEFRTQEWVRRNHGWTPSGLEGDVPVWVVDEDIVMGFAGGASVVNKSNQKVLGADFIHWPLTEVSPAASLVEPRLALMDDVGILGQVMYPNAVGFGGQAIQSIKDEKLKLMIIQIWNDAMAEYQEKSGGRIMGMGLLPWWDVDLATNEVNRFAELGLHGVNTISNPHQAGLGLPDLADSHWDKLWDTIQGHNLPLNFHIGATVSQDAYEGSGPWPSMDSNRRLAIGSSMLYILNARVISNFIFSGILDRFPEMKVVSVESGVGWLPFMLEALDHQAVENAVKDLKLKPSEYFKRQMYACFWFENGDNLMRDIERLGVDNCMFETDFPHPTCLYPNPLNEIAKRFETDNVSWETRRKLLGGNAAEVYNIDLPASV